MAFQIDPGRTPGEIQPFEDVVPAQGIDGPCEMLPLAPDREQQHHDVRQHAGLGHGQHEDIDMNLQDMLPLQQVFDLEQHDAMLEDGDAQLREHYKILTCVASSFFGDKGAKALSTSRKIRKFLGVKLDISGAFVCIILHHYFQKFEFWDSSAHLMVLSTNIIF